MNDNKIADADREAFERFEKTTWEQTFSANQDSFETFTLTLRNSLRAELAQVLPHFSEMSFSDVNRMLVVIGFGAPREGARVFASLVGKSCSPRSVSQIGFEKAWIAAMAINNPVSEEFLLLRHRLEELPQIDYVLSSAEDNLRSTLLNSMPELAAYDEQIKRMLFTNLFHGVRLEFLFPILISRKDDEDKILRKLLIDAVAQDADEKKVFSRLRKSYGIEADANPWPRNLKCSCGKDLRESLICCDPESPIDPESFIYQVGPDFLFKTECCGTTFNGFRCDHCAKYYTWTHGVVESVG